MPSDSTLILPQNPMLQRVAKLRADPRFQRIAASNPELAGKMLAAAAGGPPVRLSPSAKATGGATARKPISAAEQAQLAQLQSTVQQLQALRNQFKQIDPTVWNRSGGESRVIGGVETAGAPTRLWQKYARGKGMSLAGSDDPQVQQLNTLIGNAITQHAQATAALMKSAGTRNYQFANEAKGHLPDAGADYQTNMTNLNNLLAPDGPYARMIDNIKNGTGNLPMDTSNLNALPGGTVPSATPTAAFTPPPGMSPEAADWLRSHGR